MGGGISSVIGVKELLASNKSSIEKCAALGKAIASLGETVTVEEVDLLSKSLGIVDWFVSALLECKQNGQHDNLATITAFLEPLFSKATEINNRAPNKHYLDHVCSPESKMLRTMCDLYINMDNTQHRLGGWFFSQVAKHSRSNNAYDFINSGVHVQLLNLLKDFSQKMPTSWHWNMESVLQSVMNISRHECTWTKLKEANAVPILITILTHKNSGGNSMKALVALMFLTGKDEKNIDGEEFLTLKPDAIECLLVIFDKALKILEPATFGQYSLKVLTQACLCLATSDNKKVALTQTNLLSLLKTTLDLFINDSPPLRLTNGGGAVGGGGSDIDTAENVIATLAQLSFAFDSDLELQEKYMTRKSGILQQMLVLNEFNEKLSLEARQNVMLLKSRLTSKMDVPVAEVISVTPTTSSTVTTQVQSSEQIRSHVMISYCWHKDAKPEYVKLLAKEFRQMGYDIWRDEDGSSMVPAMSGSTEERMAEAVEAASILIICVSRNYKESANCRLEAKYASQRHKQKKLEIYYVMMQNEYTTVSVPDSCDGWLGIMIGDAMWYPLWDAAHIGTSSKSLAQVFGERAKKSEYVSPPTYTTAVLSNAAVNNSTTSVKTPSGATESPSKNNALSTDSINYAAVLEFLNTTNRVESIDTVTTKLNELGIIEAEDFSGLGEDDIRNDLVPLVKKAQKKKFLALFMLDA